MLFAVELAKLAARLGKSSPSLTVDMKRFETKFLSFCSVKYIVFIPFLNESKSLYIELEAPKTE